MKSDNKLNKLWFTAEPMSEDLADAIDSGQVYPGQAYDDPTNLLAELEDRVWSFGSANSG